MTSQVSNYMIYHHGILGQRWGIRRFQPYGQGYSGSKGKFIGKKKKISKEQQKQKDLRVTKEDFDALEEERRKKTPERVGIKTVNQDEMKFLNKKVEDRRIEDAIKRANPVEISQYVTKMSTKQFQDAMQRIDLNKRLSEATEKQIRYGWNAMNKTMDKINDINKWGNTALSSGKLVKEFLKLMEEMSDSKEESNKKG